MLPASVRFVDERAIYAAGYRYEDLVRAVDVVATKPGYGIISECIANDTALLYTSRGHFAEYDVMVREMPRYLRCGFISNEDLYAGSWEPALDAVLAQPAPPERPPVDGADVVARRLAEATRRQSLMQVTSDQIRGMFTFSIETGCSSACARNPGKSRSHLNPMCTVNGESIRSAHDMSRFALRK